MKACGLAPRRRERRQGAWCFCIPGLGSERMEGGRRKKMKSGEGSRQRGRKRGDGFIAPSDTALRSTPVPSIPCPPTSQNLMPSIGLHSWQKPETSQVFVSVSLSRKPFALLGKPGLVRLVEHTCRHLAPTKFQSSGFARKRRLAASAGCEAKCRKESED